MIRRASYRISSLHRKGDCAITEGYIRNLTDLCAADRESCGGKAVGLASLAAAGLPVPPGFVILPAAFRKHLEVNRPGSEFPDRDDIESAAIPEEVSIAVIAAFEELVSAVPGYVAVRSSAAAEDGADTSFAGQFETFLNVDRDGLLDAVKSCWASTVNERVRAYAGARGLSDSLTIAVVVQSQVPAESSGLLFTANPRSGRLSEMVVNVTGGLGEKLVSGLVTPDVYILDREKRCIKTRTLHSKTVDGETAVVPFDDDVAAHLLEIGEKAEAEFGCPQDIEWAFADGTIWLLQSRPITTLAKIPARPVEYSNYYVWTNVNFAETMPQPASRLGWSLMKSGTDDVMAYGLVMTGHTPFHMFDIIYGRPYWEMTFFFRSKWWLRAIKYLIRNLDARLPDVFQKIADDREFRVKPVFKPYDRYRFYVKVVSFIVKFGSGILAALMGSKRFVKRVMRWDRRLEERVLESARIEGEWRDILQNLDRIRLSLSKTTRDWYIPLFYSAMILYADYSGFWRSWVGEALDINQLGLVRAENDMTVACGNSMMALAGEAAGTPEVASILENAPRGEWLEKLKSEPAADEFNRQFDEFLYRFGHRGPSEQDVIQPRYIEKPELALMAVRNMMACAGGPPLGTADEEKRKRDIGRVREYFRGKRFGRLKRFILDTYRKLLGPVMPFRENGKHIFFKYFLIAKRFVLKAGEGMAAEKIISSPNDVFFLTLPELTALSKVPIINVRELRDKIRTRRADYMRYQGVAAPMMIVSDGECIYLEPEGMGEAELSGEGVSAGTATGRVRIVHDPYGDVKLEPGDILVAPQTDPGWTPLFVGAGGVITEVGGMLTHSAVVAREYGIPAIVNLLHATRILEEGETITINGTTGKVYRKGKNGE